MVNFKKALPFREQQHHSKEWEAFSFVVTRWKVAERSTSALLSLFNTNRFDMRGGV